MVDVTFDSVEEYQECLEQANLYVHFCRNGLRDWEGYEAALASYHEDLE